MIKKIIKITLGIIIFITLPTALLFATIYFKYNENLPISKPSKEADILAQKMLDAIHINAYKETSYIEFTFNNRHHYKWQKNNNFCKVYWKQNEVHLELSNLKNSKVFIAKQAYNGIEKNEYIQKALNYFNNDTFWLVAPYKIFDVGTTRSIARNEAGDKGLLVTYNSGGSTPGDSYLWHLNKNYTPKGFQMWTSIFPIKGFPASWANWKTTQTKIKLPQTHKLGFISLNISNIKTH